MVVKLLIYAHVKDDSCLILLQEFELNMAENDTFGVLNKVDQHFRYLYDLFVKLSVPRNYISISVVVHLGQIIRDVNFRFDHSEFHVALACKV